MHCQIEWLVLLARSHRVALYLVACQCVYFRFHARESLARRALSRHRPIFISLHENHAQQRQLQS